MQNDNLTYPHIQRVTVDQPKNSKAKLVLTGGKQVVTEILAWDEEAKAVYFMATKENMPGPGISTKLMTRFWKICSVLDL